MISRLSLFVCRATMVFIGGACEPDRLMTLADGVFPERQEGFFFAPLKKASCLVTFSL